MQFRHRTRLKGALEKYFRDECPIETESSNIIHKTLEELASLAIGGKLLRGSLFLEGFESAEIHPYHIDIAMAIELIHSAFLIHDDIMDQSLDRRGRLSSYVFWAQSRASGAENWEQFTHYGMSQAICMGDLAIFLAQELLLRSTYEAQISILRFVQKGWAQVCLGQMQDVDFGSYAYSRGFSVEEILSMYEKKTAFYTFSMPLLCFAICSGWDSSDQKKLSLLGKHLGLLFQIRDDYLDIFGDTIHIKKRPGQDIKEKKKTLHLCLLYQNLKEDERSQLEFMSQKNDVLSNEELEKVKEWIKTRGIEEKISKYVETLADKVKISLAELKDKALVSTLEKVLESLQKS